jgi:hypothetical protein
MAANVQAVIRSSVAWRAANPRKGENISLRGYENIAAAQS